MEQKLKIGRKYHTTFLVLDLVLDGLNTQEFIDLDLDWPQLLRPHHLLTSVDLQSGQKTSFACITEIKQHR
jgi:hypothetical protein